VRSPTGTRSGRHSSADVLDGRVIFYGEDVAEYGSFKLTKGL
jgi:hypothetical protein